MQIDQVQLGLLQDMEKVLKSVSQLENICKQIGQKHQNPNIKLFMREFFRYLQQGPIKLFGDACKLLDKLIKDNQDAEIKNCLQDYFQKRLTDCIAAYYENAIMISSQEGFKQMQLLHNQKLLESSDDREMSRIILAKLESAYRQKQTAQECEELLFYQLTSEEQLFFTKLLTLFDSKQSQEISQIQNKTSFSAPNIDNAKVQQDVNSKKGLPVNKLQVEYEELKSLMELSLLKSESKARKHAFYKEFLQKKKIQANQHESHHFQQPCCIKYYYQSLKVKTLSGEARFPNGATVSFRSKLQEFMKIAFEATRWCKVKELLSKTKWEEQYRGIYDELKRSTTYQGYSYWFEILKKVQQLRANLHQFRFNYLYLFQHLIIESKRNEPNIGAIITKAFENLRNTKLPELTLNFTEVSKRALGKELKLDEVYISHKQVLWQIQGLHHPLIQLDMELMKLKEQKEQKDLRPKVEMLTDLAELEISIFTDSKNYLNIFQQRPMTNQFFKGLGGEELEKKIKRDQPLSRNDILGSDIATDARCCLFKRDYLLTYFESYWQRLRKLQTDQFTKIQEKYIENLALLKADFEEGKTPIQDILQRERDVNCFMKSFFEFLLRQPNLKREDRFVDVCSLFIKYVVEPNFFGFFLPTIWRGLVYYLKEQQLNLIIERCEKFRYQSYGLAKEKWEDFFLKSQSLSLQDQFQAAQTIYNNVPKHFGGKTEEWTQKFYFPQEVEGLCSEDFNHQLVLMTKIFPIDESQKPIKSVPEFLQSYKLLQEYVKKVQQPTDKSLLQSRASIIHYKQQLVRDSEKNAEYNQKVMQAFQLCSTRQMIIQYIAKYKQSKDIPLLEPEALYYARQIVNEKRNRTKIDDQECNEYLKKILSKNTWLDLRQSLKQDLERNALHQLAPSSREFIKQVYEELIKIKLKEGLPSGHQAAAHSQMRGILNKDALLRKLSALRTRERYHGYCPEDAQVTHFITEQFELFMKDMIERVLSTALIQKDCNEFKVYQTISEPSQSQTQYMQAKKLQIRLGPKELHADGYNQQRQREDLLLLSFELCDYTPAQRQNETSRRYLIEMEQKQDEIQLSKIRQNKWRDEHPELEEALKKRIKRGTELWSNVQEFLQKSRQDVQSNDSDSEDQDRKQNQQKEQEKDIEVLKQEMGQTLKKYEELQKNNKQLLMKTLRNKEANNQIQNKLNISTKTVQYVLESMPYYQRSRIVYKSYVL